MSEQMRLIRSGGEGRFRLSREYIDVCLDEDGRFSCAIGSVNSRDPSYSWDRDQLNGKLNGLLGLYYQEPERWTDHVVELRLSNHEKPISGRRLRATGESRPIGSFIHDITFEDMPMDGIMGELDGEGGATLVLRLDEARVLEVIGSGVYGRERYYKDSERDEMPDVPTVSEGFVAVEDKHDPLYLGFLDWHQMSFAVQIAGAPVEQAA